jgi:hypothetical protein
MLRATNRACRGARVRVLNTRTQTRTIGVDATAGVDAAVHDSQLLDGRYVQCFAAQHTNNVLLSTGENAVVALPMRKHARGHSYAPLSMSLRMTPGPHASIGMHKELHTA